MYISFFIKHEKNELYLEMETFCIYTVIDIMVPFSAIWTAKEKRNQTDEKQRGCPRMQVDFIFYLGLTNFNKCMWIVDGSSCSFFRNKKKEYIKCLENRVAVLENQNKVVKRFQYCTSFASIMTICNTSPFSGPYRGVKKSKRTVHRAEELTLNHFDL